MRAYRLCCDGQELGMLIGPVEHFLYPWKFEDGRPFCFWTEHDPCLLAIVMCIFLRREEEESFN